MRATGAAMKRLLQHPIEPAITRKWRERAVESSFSALGRQLAASKSGRADTRAIRATRHSLRPRVCAISACDLPARDKGRILAMSA